MYLFNLVYNSYNPSINSILIPDVSEKNINLAIEQLISGYNINKITISSDFMTGTISCDKPIKMTFSFNIKPIKMIEIS